MAQEADDERVNDNGQRFDGNGAVRMSVQLGYLFAAIPEWVLYHPKLTGDDVRVFGVLARYGNDIRPAKATIAKKISKSDKTVSRCVERLVAVGAVVVERRSEEGVQLPNRYHLAGDSPVGGGVTLGGRGGVKPDGGVGSPVTTKREQDNESKDNESNTPLTPPQGGKDEPGFEEFWALYPHCRSNKAPTLRRWNSLTNAERERAKAALPKWVAYWAATDQPEFVPASEVWLGTKRSKKGHQFDAMVPPLPACKPTFTKMARNIEERKQTIQTTAVETLIASQKEITT